MKIYRGQRSGYAVDTTVNGRALNPRFDLWNHSPSGFEWGYGGSGPAQLALAKLPHHCWKLSSRQIEEALQPFRGYKCGKGADRLTDLQGVVLTQLRRRNYYVAADEAERCWNQGRRTHLDLRSRWPRWLRQLFVEANDEAIRHRRKSPSAAPPNCPHGVRAAEKPTARMSGRSSQCASLRPRTLSRTATLRSRRWIAGSA